MTAFTKRRIFRLFSFLSPAIILAVYFAVKKITPFGNNTFLIHDMDAQYIDFYAYFRTVLQGENDVFYSFSRGLGGDFISFYFYYLVNPFNLIPTLLHADLMPAGISIEMMILFGFAGLSVFYALDYFTENGPYGKNYPLLLFLSIAYSFSAWMVLNAENFQFIQEAALLPVVIVSCQKAKKENKLLPAVLWLSLAVILNFYLGYMICIFALLWMIIPDENHIQYKHIIIFAAVVFITSPVWISELRVIGSTVKEVSEKWYITKFNFGIPDFLRKLLPGQFDHLQYQDEGLPAVYCSLIALFCALISFIVGKNRKILIHRFILLVILTVSLFFRPLTMIWQGFSQPHWWPYRFSFLFIFMIILCAAESRLLIPWFILPLGLVSIVYNLNVTFSVKLTNAKILSAYSEKIAEKSSVLSSINQEEKFFRIEDLSPRSDNDGMFFNYAGITHFDSLANKNVFRFLERAGFPKNRYTLQYGLGNTRFINQLLGIRYVLSDDSVFTEIPDSSIAFLLSEEVSSEIPDVESSAEFQNILASQMGFPDPVLNNLVVEQIDYENLECNEDFCWKIDPEADAAFIYHFMAPQNSIIYVHAETKNLIGDIYIETINKQRVKLPVVDYFIPLLNTESSSQMVMRFSVDSVMSDFPNLTFYVETMDNNAAAYSEITNDVNVYRKTSSELDVTYPPAEENQMLLLTIPYSDRWKAYAQNEIIETVKIWDTFIGLLIPSESTGVHLIYR